MSTRTFSRLLSFPQICECFCTAILTSQGSNLPICLTGTVSLVQHNVSRHSSSRRREAGNRSPGQSNGPMTQPPPRLSTSYRCSVRTRSSWGFSWLAVLAGNYQHSRNVLNDLPRALQLQHSSLRYQFVYGLRRITGDVESLIPALDCGLCVNQLGSKERPRRFFMNETTRRIAPTNTSTPIARNRIALKTMFPS